MGAQRGSAGGPDRASHHSLPETKEVLLCLLSYLFPQLVTLPKSKVLQLFVRLTFSKFLMYIK